MRAATAIRLGGALHSPPSSGCADLAIIDGVTRK
jgi:hypothetical protein